MTEAEPKIRRRLTRQWWFPAAVVVFVLLALVGAEELGLLGGGQDALCAARDVFVKMAGGTPDACP